MNNYEERAENILEKVNKLMKCETAYEIDSGNFEELESNSLCKSVMRALKDWVEKSDVEKLRILDSL